MIRPLQFGKETIGECCTEVAGSQQATYARFDSPESFRYKTPVDRVSDIMEERRKIRTAEEQ